MNAKVTRVRTRTVMVVALAAMAAGVVAGTAGGAVQLVIGQPATARGSGSAETCVRQAPPSTLAPGARRRPACGAAGGT